MIHWWRRHFPSYGVCWYDDCGEWHVGTSKWCRFHTDMILAGVDCHLWPLRKGAEWHMT